MRFYISADIEGVAGVVTSAHTRPEGFEYQAARRWMTQEVLAAIEGLREAGGREFVVSDSHGNGLSLLLDELPQDVQLVRSWPRPLHQMQGIESGRFAGALLLGYHSSACAAAGVLAHTVSTAAFIEVRLNGKAVSEAVICTGIAGHYGVPVIAASGDDAFAAELRQHFPAIRTAVVKNALGTRSAQCLTPAAACALIRHVARDAAASAATMSPMKIAAPISLEIDMTSRVAVELLAYLPIFERRGARTIVYQARDMVEIAKVISFVGMYSATA